jgi:hypothetical protein
MKKSWATLLAVLLAGAILFVARHQLDVGRGQLNQPELALAVPRPEFLHFAALGNDALAADLLLARTLAAYGSLYYQKKIFPQPELKALFFTVCRLDPVNEEVFLMGGNLLSQQRPADARELLRLAMMYHPQSWRFPEMIGFTFFFRTHQYFPAARYYEIAARLPGHPPYVPSLSGKFYRQAGHLEMALRVLNNFYITAQDPRLKESFRQEIEAIRQQLAAEKEGRSA